MRKLTGSTLLVLLVMSPTLRAGATPKNGIDSAASQLGDPDPAIRAEAAQTLREAGKSAASLLRQSARSDDPEVAARASALLLTLGTGEPDSHAIPEPVALHRYDGASILQRRRIVMEMSGRAGAAMVARLWAIERDDDLRAAEFEKMLAFPSASASSLLADGNVATARLVLETGLARHSQEALEAYAAFCVCRGEVDAAIQRWSARAQQPPPDFWAQSVLAGLYRAKGDAANARRFAQKSEIRQLSDNILLATGDYAGVARALRNRPDAPTQARELSVLMACDHLAGDAASFADDLRKVVAATRSARDAVIASNAMLLCDRPDDAVRLLSDHSDWAGVFETLVARGQLDAAFDLVQRHDPESTKESMVLRATAAKIYARLGELARARELLERVSEENEKLNAEEVYISLGEAERALGRTDRAWTDFESALSHAKDDSPVAYELNRAFGDRELDIDWYALWRLLQQSNPPDAGRRNFQAMRAIHDGTMPIEQVRDLSRWNGHGPLNAPVRAQLAREAARRLADSGKLEQADALLEAESQRAESPDLFVQMGDLSADRKQWERAARWYEIAWEADRSAALPLYLRGWALAQAGHLAAGREAADLARILSLSSDYTRYELMRALDARGLSEAMAGEAAVVLRVAQPMNVASDVAARVEAERAKQRGDARTEAALLRGMIVHLSAGNFWFRERSAYLVLPMRVHRAAARAALIAGDLPAMHREMQACASLAPDDIELPIELVPELEKRGHQAEADALFARSLAAQQALCKRFPGSASQHNQLAWLAAECRRELDLALEHAKRAVELEPNRTAYLDTLAEVYFQRGQFDDATAQMRKCIGLEPRVHHHQQQLRKFEAAKGRGSRMEDRG